jgi:hypothetical protein
MNAAGISFKKKFIGLALFWRPDTSMRHSDDEVSKLETGKSHELATPSLDIYVREGNSKLTSNIASSQQF